MPIDLSLLTSDQQQQVAAKQRTPRPQYYSANAQAWVEISKEFEVELILMTPQTRAGLAQWLASINNQLMTYADRDELMIEAINAQLNSVEPRLLEYEATMAAYNNVEGLAQIAHKENSAEMTSLVADLGLGIDEMVAGQAGAKYIEMMLAATHQLRLYSDPAQLAKGLRGRLDQDRLQEASSFVAVLGTY